jgi:hypothetical protein
MVAMQWDELRFSSAVSALETEKTNAKGQTRLFHYPPEAWGKRSAARFRKVGGAL